MDASKAAMDTSNAALAQLVLGLFTPHGALFAGPGCSHPAPILWLAQGAYGVAWYLRSRSPFWGFLRPMGPFSWALGCSHPAPILWLAQGAYGVAWAHFA
ncbi:hypothetical protein B0H14DRAFT_3445733 [Mycena olivaceomarginata]|nr:hypothetical protein B0H14DRAFT_3445733 [Mycena olivaceomarginata]